MIRGRLPVQRFTRSQASMSSAQAAAMTVPDSRNLKPWYCFQLMPFTGEVTRTLRRREEEAGHGQPSKWAAFKL